MASNLDTKHNLDLAKRTDRLPPELSPMSIISKRLSAKSELSLSPHNMRVRHLHDTESHGLRNDKCKFSSYSSNTALSLSPQSRELRHPHDSASPTTTPIRSLMFRSGDEMRRDGPDDRSVDDYRSGEDDRPPDLILSQPHVGGEGRGGGVSLGREKCEMKMDVTESHREGAIINIDTGSSLNDGVRRTPKSEGKGEPSKIINISQLGIKNFTRGRGVRVNMEDPIIIPKVTPKPRFKKAKDNSEDKDKVKTPKLKILVRMFEGPGSSQSVVNRTRPQETRTRLSVSDMIKTQVGHTEPW